MNKNKKKLSLKKVTIETLAGSSGVAGGTGTVACHYTYYSCHAGSCGCGESPTCNCAPCVAGY